MSIWRPAHADDCVTPVMPEPLLDTTGTANCCAVTETNYSATILVVPCYCAMTWCRQKAFNLRGCISHECNSEASQGSIPAVLVTARLQEMFHSSNNRRGGKLYLIPVPPGNTNRIGSSDMPEGRAGAVKAGSGCQPGLCEFEGNMRLSW